MSNENNPKPNSANSSNASNSDGQNNQNAKATGQNKSKALANLMDRMPLIYRASDADSAELAAKGIGKSRSSRNQYAELLIESLPNQIEDFHVYGFLEEVLAEPDIREVLACPIYANGKDVRRLVQAVIPLAEEARHLAHRCTVDVDAVYVATILMGVDYCFLPALRGKYNAADALKTIVLPALRRLDRNAPEAAGVLRTCMRWGDFDEESYFVDWLKKRMHHALDVLDLLQF